MIAGVGFGVYALYIVSLLWSSADQYRATGNDDAGLIEPLLIAIALIGLVIAAAPVWLGGLVLRRRRWARYALLAFGLLAAWGAGAWVFTRAFAFALWVIPLLLIWAELRSRDLVPPFRRNWRGYVLLSVNAAMFFGLALFAALDSPVVEAATGSDLSTGSAMMGVGSIVWFALGVPAAMWAINRDSEPLLSGLNGRLVVWAPALISFVGLVMAVASVVGGQGADWLS